MAYLEIDRLSAFYGRAQALFEVSLNAEQGDIIAVIGANGAGKSTLFDSVMGLTNAQGGIRLDGESLIGMNPSAIVRRGVGYAPERFNLFPYMTVRDNLLVGAYTAREEIAKNLDMVHTLFPRLEEREAQETSTQSGGERQMVSLGRALMTSPKLLLVDALKRLRGEFGLTILMAEQNANFALSLSDRIYVLESGRVTAQGTHGELSDDEALAAAYFGH